ncbi:MAG: DUF72 domain-containing protein [Aestuariivirgaceae bacterium]
MTGRIHVGVGGWTFEPWRGVFYPKDLPHKRELEYASRALTSIEINGTYYSTFKPDSWQKWDAETPDGFKFAVKGSRFCTNRRVLSDALSAKSIGRFIEQGLHHLGDKLGPINWQFMATKKYDAEDFAGFLKLLPKETGGVRLRHAVEIRHDSFCDAEFYGLARRHDIAIVYAKEETFPEIDEATSDFTYARLMSSREDLENGLEPKELKHWARKAKAWAKRGDVFLYFISGAKLRNPAAAQALLEALP